MDRSYIDNEHIVERYLSGELTVREAREFEEYCQNHPQDLKSMRMPARLKARLAKQPGADSETGVFKAIPSSATRATAQAAESGFDPDDDAEWNAASGDKRGRTLVVGLSATLIAAVAAAGYFYFQASALEDDLQRTQREFRDIRMQAPGSVQHYKVQMLPNKPARANLELGLLKPPQLLELHVDASQTKYTAYRVTIDKADGTRALIVQRVARDSNRELRLALNSSAFGPGDYLLRIDGYNWRGQTDEIGWVRLGLQ